MSDMVSKEKFNMNICRYIVLDEADRLLDMIFEKEIRNIIDHVPVHSLLNYKFIKIKSLNYYPLFLLKTSI